MERLLLVVAGGVLGTGCRYLLSSYVYAHLSKPTFPWAKLLVNVSGSFVRVVEIVDSPEKIAAFLPVVESMVRGGLVALERVQVIRYAHDATSD